MKTENITVANLKCGGCGNTIQKALSKLENVIQVSVDVENSLITVETSVEMRAQLIEKLVDLGYPEATMENGLLTKIKSYGSCMLGKMDI